MTDLSTDDHPHEMTADNARATCSTMELAQRAGVSLQTVQRWVDAGLITAWKTPGGHRRIDMAAADCFLATRSREQVMRGPKGFALTKKTILRVLVVEGEPRERDLLIAGARKALPFAEVLGAENGFDALILIGKIHPAIVLTNIHLQQVNSFQMIRHLQGLPRHQVPLIIAISQASSQELAAQGQLPATVPVLYRPFEPARLGELLQAAGQSLSEPRS